MSESVPQARASGPTLQAWPVIAAVAVLCAALFVRSIDGGPPLDPSDRTRDRDALPEPMQLLGRGAATRVAELDERVSPTLRAEWTRLREVVFALARCPRTGDWLDTVDGLAFERLFSELRRGTRDDALAAQVLLVEIARRTKWAPGLLARTSDAERLAALQREWMRTWGSRSASDAQLSEPALSGLLLQARLERATYVRVIGRDRERFERAIEAFRRLLEDAQGEPTALARALDARHPGLAASLAAREDGLEPFDTVAGHFFPGLNGECE
ncbi:MAG: hypothetical protein FJ298_11265 [Planctomycetes bacterium]|nr:hypothetical protein [Planctomycetota bacterium]